MFSRDYYDPRSQALWGIRVRGTSICVHNGRNICFFDLDHPHYSSTYTWGNTNEAAMAYAESEIQVRQEAGWIETERSRSRRCFELVKDKHSKF
jgi:hypothetical protein